MLKNNFNKIIKNNLYFIILISILFLAILATNYYTAVKSINEKNLINFLENSYLKKSINLIANNLEPKFSYKSFKVEQGDTFEKIISNLKVPKSEKNAVINYLSKFKFINNLYKGQKITFKMDNAKPIKIVEINVEKSKTKALLFTRSKDLNKFKFEEVNKNLNKLVVYRESIIKNSLYESAINEKINENIIIEFARIYGFQVDFQRDIRKQDKFQIMYEIFLNEKNEIIETGEILERGARGVEQGYRSGIK